MMQVAVGVFVHKSASVLSSKIQRVCRVDEVRGAVTSDPFYLMKRHIAIYSNIVL